MPRPLLLAAACLLLSTPRPVCADEPPGPYAGWNHRAPGAKEALRRPPPEPRPLSVQSSRGLGRTLGELLAAGQPLKAARLLDARTRIPALREALIHGDAGILIGAQEDARQRLRRLPPEILAALATERSLALTPSLGRADDASLLERITQAPATPHALEALTRLGERAFEAGRLDDAGLYWRRARTLDSAATSPLALRLLKLRSLPSHEPHPATETEALQLLWARPWIQGSRQPSRARGLAVGPERVYFVDGDTLCAASRATGRLEWTAEEAGPGTALALCSGVLVQGSHRGLRGLDPRTGAVAWSLPMRRWRAKGAEAQPGDRCLALAPCADGVAALLTVDRLRRVTLVSGPGKIAWTTRLWDTDETPLVPPPIMLVEPSAPSGDACTNPEDKDGACPSRGAFKAGVHPEKERRLLRPRYMAPAYRPVLNDGQLASVGGRLFLTADGFVAALGAGTGELIWLRDRLTGLGVGGDGTVRVALSASAFSVEAVTACGLLVRLDPLDGTSLALPRGEEGSHILRLASRPLALAWRRPKDTTLTVGESGRSLGPLPITPLWPGCSVRGVLAIPTGTGLALLNTQRPRPPRLLNWPLGAGPVTQASGALVVTSPLGIAVYGPGPASTAAPLPSPLFVEHLGDPDWRVRLAARRALTERLSTAAEALRPALEAAEQSPDPEVACSVRALLTALRRRDRWQDLAPGVQPNGLEAALSDRSRVAAFATLLAAADPAKRTVALASEFLERQDPGAQLALFELLLHTDRRARGRAVAFARTSPDPGARRAVADLLIAVTQAGGSTRPLEILVRHELKTPPGGPVIAALAAEGDAALWAKVAGDRQQIPLPALQQWFQQNPSHDPDPQVLLRELRPFVKRLAGR